MRKFKKGQRVWWNDPIMEMSGEYDVLDPQDELNFGKPEHMRSIRIGNGEETWNVLAEYLTIVFPISFVEREQIGIQEYRNRLLDKELLGQIKELVSQFEDRCFTVEGHSVRIGDEDHDACCVYGFLVDEDILYAQLEYDDDRERTIPASDLCAMELFDAFCTMVKSSKPLHR